MVIKLLQALLFLTLSAVAGRSALANGLEELIDKAMAGSHRSPEFVTRDKFRHPKETLKFFGLTPELTVVEVWPSRGWYTEILAPVLKPYGVFYAAGFATTVKQTPDFMKNIHIEFLDKLSKRPDVYDHVVVTELHVPDRTVIAPPGTVDMILTFRNVHNWMKAGTAQGMLETFFRTLKSGGVLGIVEHRAKPGTPLATMVDTGYVTTEFITALAEAVGFHLDESSEINANPNDTRGYPDGVWSLPPTLRTCEKIKSGADRSACAKKYTAIGESDRMTLRFRKP